VAKRRPHFDAAAEAAAVILRIEQAYPPIAQQFGRRGFDDAFIRA